MLFVIDVLLLLLLLRRRRCYITVDDEFFLSPSDFVFLFLQNKSKIEMTLSVLKSSM